MVSILGTQGTSPFGLSLPVCETPKGGQCTRESWVISEVDKPHVLLLLHLASPSLLEMQTSAPLRLPCCKVWGGQALATNLALLTSGGVQAVLPPLSVCCDRDAPKYHAWPPAPAAARSRCPCRQCSLSVTSRMHCGSDE